MDWKKLDLEISLKPFRDHSEAGIREVAHTLFGQWRRLIEKADQVSLMFWGADGSEILDYNGRLEDRFEWCKWVGVANPHHPDTGLPPDLKSMHESPRLYMENPPEYTYGDFKRVLTVLKDVFRELYGKELRLGTTFDSGPEFAISDFKYKRHPEVCAGFCLGGKTFVCCYRDLHADDRPYAGFPAGIPEGTSFGTFLGRQSTHFLKDLGFDYLWLSNGFGFGMETWGITGAIFDGVRFTPERARETMEKMFGFWTDFRRECSYPLETRGTNLSTGMDLSTDGTPTREIYRNVKDMEPPVNSPWAALNGDFGMELAGWMSHIAELPPGKGFPFRYYLHDPWFVNSPWLDRYSRSPYDLYLPLSITRLSGEGKAETPSALHLLTVDDSYGRLPELVPAEASGYLIDAAMTLPDAAGPLVWVYPFDEYHDEVYAGNRLDEVFAGDFFIRGAINQGFPLNTVISGANFLAARAKGKTLQSEILLLPTLFTINPAVMSALREHVEAGGKAILYGPARGEAVEQLIGLLPAPPIEGEMKLESVFPFNGPDTVKHLATWSAGSLDRIADPSANARTLAEYVQGSERRPAALLRNLGKGELIWIRGSNAFRMDEGKSYTIQFEPELFFQGEKLLRYALECFGYSIRFRKDDPAQPGLCLTLRRHDNAVYMVGHAALTTGDFTLRLPDGAPVFSRCDTVLENNRTRYHNERSANLEARVFVTGDDSTITCRDTPQCLPGIERRIRLTGLKNATVVYRPEIREGLSYNFTDDTRNPSYALWSKPDYEFEKTSDANGPKFIIRNVTGTLVISSGTRHEFR